ncbi:hypothetical protein OAN24_01515, partial [Pseudodesulfovibrio sp.]|nr:hypothetical protein [Pseudodesulfovibrio sp.]
FDNTLVAYGHAFRDLAVERGLVPEAMPPDKMTVRTHVWGHHDDIEWQKLQVAVYGHNIDRGRLMDGAADFLVQCRDRGINLSIVSHKSEFSAIDPGGVNLRQAALGWMEDRGFFLPVCSGGFGFSPGDVFFESKREGKVARINGLGCDVFVDDLIEVLDHADLDDSIERILFQDKPGEADCCVLAGPWPTIARHLFNHQGRT